MVEQIAKQMQDIGIDVFGTSDCSGLVSEKFADTPYAITLGVRLSGAVIDKITGGPTKMYFAHYRAVNTMLDGAALRCVVMLQRGGYDALAVPASQTTNSAAIAGDFPHKTAASKAGLGFVGKSGLFVTSEFGPRVRFATVLTDMEMESKPISKSECGECRLCVSACPCGAIAGREWRENTGRDDIVDAALCARYMKDKYQKIGRGSVCGICVAVCPMYKKSPKNAK